MVILRSGRDTVNQPLERCSICLCENNEVSWSLNCNHCFHKECLRNHFLASLEQHDNFVPECPNCRNPICDETNYDSETSIDLGDEPEPIPILEYLVSIGFDLCDALRHCFQWNSNVFDKIEIICKCFIMMCVEVPFITEERLSVLLSLSTMPIFELGKAEFPKFSSNEMELVRKIIEYSLRQSKFGIPLPKFRNGRMLQTIMSTTDTYAYACSIKRPLTIESIVRIDNGMLIHLTYASDGPSSSSNCTFVLSNGPNIFTIERELLCESDQATIVNASFKLLNSDNGAIVNGASFVIQCFVMNNRGYSVSSNVIACSLQSRASEFNNNSYSQS
jgi:hypothetical protein